MFSIDQKLNLHFWSNSQGHVIIYRCSIILSSQNEKKCFLKKCEMKGGSIKNLLGWKPNGLVDRVVECIKWQKMNQLIELFLVLWKWECLCCLL
jgi:hypothetical protein